MNTCHLWPGEWKPTYYCTVDQRVMREFGDGILDRYRDIPKFTPRPNLDKWQGENFYHFLHRPGKIFEYGITPPTEDFLQDGAAYSNVMSIVLQLAWHMGFTTCLMIGVEHKPMKAQNHFWGCDHGMSATPPLEDWFSAYREIVTEMQKAGIKVLNISENTYLDENIIPRGDWRDWSKNEGQNERIFSRA